MPQTIEDIIKAADLVGEGFSDIAPQRDKFLANQEASGGRIMASLAEMRQPEKRGIMDFIAPALLLAGTISDATGRNRSRRANAGRSGVEAFQNIQGIRQSRRKEKRQKTMDQLAVEEMLGKLRGQSFDVVTKGAGRRDINRRTSLSTATTAKRLDSSGTKGPSPDDIEKRAVDGILDKYTDPRTGNINWDGMPGREKFRVEAEYGGDAVPDPAAAVAEYEKGIRDKWEKRYSKTIEMLIEAGDDKALNKLLTHMEVQIKNELTGVSIDDLGQVQDIEEEEGGILSGIGDAAGNVLDGLSGLSMEGARGIFAGDAAGEAKRLRAWEGTKEATGTFLGAGRDIATWGPRQIQAIMDFLSKSEAPEQR